MPGTWFRCSLLALLGLGPSSAQAQQLEPRAFAPNPAGINFVALAAGRTEGDVLLDASAPIEDFRIEVNDFALGYGRTFGWGSRLASLGLVLPYAHGDASGVLDGEPRSVHRSGFGDLKLRFTTSLLAGSALSPAEFARAPPRGTLGLSLVVSAPSGHYLDEKIVNIGTNRWAFKPEIGGSRQFGRWNVDGSIGAWFFTANPDYLEESRRRQDPIGAIQGHVSYTFAPRLWLGLSFTWYVGGRTLIDGESQRDTQNNTRAGLTLALPIGSQQSVKLAYSTGTSTRTGGDFDAYMLSWQYLWFDRARAPRP